MNSLRLGLVGAGWIAKDHVAALTKFEGVELAAVCDIQRARAERLAPPGARVYERWEALLDRERLRGGRRHVHDWQSDWSGGRC